MGHCIIHNNRTADVPSAFSVFSAHQMPTPGAMALYLAGSGNLDSFAQSLMGLLFRHQTISLIEYTQNHASEKSFTADFFRAKKHKRCSLCYFPSKVNNITGRFS